MALATTTIGDAYISGSLELGGTITPAQARATLLAAETVIDWIPLGQFRCWDTASQLLPATAANDDLACLHGTLGTAPIYISAGDVKTLSGTRYGRIQWRLKSNYVSGQAVSVVILCGMQTTVAGTSCEIDVNCYSSDLDLTMSSDICATAAQSMNSLTYATKTFTITPTGFTNTTELDIRVATIYVDGATGTAVIPNILNVGIQQVVKGG